MVGVNFVLLSSLSPGYGAICRPWHLLPFQGLAFQFLVKTEKLL